MNNKSNNRTKDKLTEFFNLLHNLKYQTNPGVHTFCKCECKRGISRNGLICPRCIQDKLDLLVGPITARNVVNSVELINSIHNRFEDEDYAT
jgi:hypothetical protein